MQFFLLIPNISTAPPPQFLQFLEKKMVTKYSCFKEFLAILGQIFYEHCLQYMGISVSEKFNAYKQLCRKSAMLVNSYVGKMQYCKDYVGLVQYLCVGQVQKPIRSVGKSALLRIVGRLQRSSVRQKHGPPHRHWFKALVHWLYLYT